MVVATYSEIELGEIQDIISGKRQLSSAENDILRDNFSGKKIPGTIYSFLGLYATNPDLYRKLSEDDLVSQYSLFGFFPETFGLFYGSEVLPETSLDGGNRGLVAIIKHPTKKVVIKPAQSSREREIAKIADELGVGPKQFPSLDNYITEEFVEGELFSRLRGERASVEEMYKLGRRVGEILSGLHSRGIYYNDTILTDDMGRSHVIVPENSPAILFDYGVALDVNRHSNFNDEEVFDFARTFPGVGMFLEIPPTREQVNRLVRDFRPQLENATKEQIFARDKYFIQEGLGFAMGRIGNHVAEPFSRGFEETYKG